MDQPERRFGAFPVENLCGTLIHACDPHFIATSDALSFQLKPPCRAVILGIAHKLSAFVLDKISISHFNPINPSHPL